MARFKTLRSGLSLATLHFPLTYNMVPIQIILLTIISIGYVTKRLEVFKKEDAQPFSTVLIDLMLPALIIATFSKIDITSQLGLMSLSSFIILSVLLIFGWVVAKKYERKTSKTFTLLMGTYWGATLAFPFILGTFGEEGFKIFVFYDVVQALFMSTIIPFIAEGKQSSFAGLKKLIKNPLFISLVIALSFNLFKISTPFTDELFTLISKGIVFIGLLIVGLNLELHVEQWKKPLFIISTKIILGFILGIILATAFGFSGLHRTILLLAATLPPSLMAMIFSQKYHLDKKLAANTLTLALPISIVVMTLISIFF